MRSIHRAIWSLSPVLILLLLQSGCQSTGQTITLGDLLKEMTDRETLARFPDPEYTCRQFSSYNTRSENPGDYTWFANLDNNYFLRTETERGRREFVLFDAQGPGCVVRFWATFARYDGEGILRFYFDNEDTPGIEGEAMEILSGGGLAEAPLSFSVSEETDYSRRGHNLYLPIPYNGHLKITYESDGIPEARDGFNETVEPGMEMFYYQVNYRTYDPGVEMATFRMEDLEEYRRLIRETQDKLKRRDRGLDDARLETIHFSDTLETMEGKEITLDGSRAVRRILLQLNAEDLPQALRSTVLQATFDGDQTIWAPVGDFFGTGYRLKEADTWYQQVKSDGTMQVFWIMPFQKSCSMKFVNYGQQPVEIVRAEVSSSSWQWDERSMHFGSSWYQNTRINTGLEKDRDGRGEFYDIPYTELDGQGVYVGDGVTLFNCSPAWWGEGDEKIFVDGEDFPSHFGTGTEDYYGYAWCRPEPFIHPFIAQPDGSGNLDVGYTLDMRYRCLDAIPFREHLKFDMEMWHWGYTIMNLAPVTYWYIKPGGVCGIPPDLSGTREEVVLKREQIFPPVVGGNGVVEGEDLVLISYSGGGEIRIRPIPVDGKPRWTKSARVWTGVLPEDEARFEFYSREEGTCRMTVAFLSGGGSVELSLLINGDEVLKREVPGGEGMQEIQMDLKRVGLAKGSNDLVLVIHDAPENGEAALGIDYLEFTKL